MVVSYFKTNYIGSARGPGQRRRRVEPVFPIRIWNIYACSENGKPRTNNYHIEGFHNALRISVTNVHSNIWSLITAVKKEEALNTARIAHIEHGDTTTKKKNTGMLINVEEIC